MPIQAALAGLRTRDADAPSSTPVSEPGWQSVLRGRSLALAGGALAVVVALAWFAVRALGMGGAGG